MGNSKTNINIEVVNKFLLFDRVKLLQTIDEFKELNVLIQNLKIEEIPLTTYPKVVTVPKHPLLSPKQVKFLFRVVQYHSLRAQGSQLLRLEHIALFAEFYNVPSFLKYIKNNFFQGTVNKASRAVLWLNRSKHLFDTRFTQACLNNTADYFGTTRERLEQWTENKNPRLTNVNLRKHLRAKRQAFLFLIRSNSELVRRIYKRDKVNCTCTKWKKRRRNIYSHVREGTSYPVFIHPRHGFVANRQ
jgi:hypothetical protein